MDGKRDWSTNTQQLHRQRQLEEEQGDREEQEEEEEEGGGERRREEDWKLAAGSVRLLELPG